MVKSLYTAGAGMMLQLVRQDAAANNLANCNTVGYKKDTVVSAAFPGMLMSRMGEKGLAAGRNYEIIGPVSTGASMEGVFTNYTQGNMQKTDNPLDAAIMGEGYFVMDTPQGERFSRDGQMEINDQNILVNKQGIPYLDQNDEPIVLASEPAISKDGSVYVNNELIAKLKIVEFADAGVLRKEGGNLINAPQNYTVMEQPQIRQGFVENSNVSTVSEMVNLISIVRLYESMQKVVQAEDEALETAITQVGSVN
ncbi:MAG: flagellar hook-basal body protein [Syntrophomonadaceae bacterium]|jgi:flagellar basal-body rod protein FlgG|nr:flagellar hook-basal body protein [Syntrophomonadaceae bacterium]